MRAASPALIALLASSDRFIMADLYTITLVGGSVLRYSAAPTALFANGYTFALGPKFERSKTKIVIGTQVVAGDINGDKKPDIVVGNKKGTFVFLHETQKVSKAEWEKAQPKGAIGTVAGN